MCPELKFRRCLAIIARERGRRRRRKVTKIATATYKSRGRKRGAVVRRRGQ
jgi:hypothetical protein